MQSISELWVTTGKKNPKPIQQMKTDQGWRQEQLVTSFPGSFTNNGYFFLSVWNLSNGALEAWGPLLGILNQTSSFNLRTWRHGAAWALWCYFSHAVPGMTRATQVVLMWLGGAWDSRMQAIYLKARTNSPVSSCFTKSMKCLLRNFIWHTVEGGDWWHKNTLSTLHRTSSPRIRAGVQHELYSLHKCCWQSKPLFRGNDRNSPQIQLSRYCRGQVFQGKLHIADPGLFNLGQFSYLYFHRTNPKGTDLIIWKTSLQRRLNQWMYDAFNYKFSFSEWEQGQK